MAVVASSSSSSATSTTTHVLHRLLRPPPQQPPPILSLFLKPLSCTTTTKFPLSKHRNTTATALFSFIHSPPITSRSLHFSHSLSASLNAVSHSLSLEQEQEQEQGQEDNHSLSLKNELEQEQEEEEEEEDGTDSGSESMELNENEVAVGVCKEGLKRNEFKVPNLTVKEKKELASYAHSLGKKLKSQLVGKSGVTDNVASSFIETLEANELLKIKIHRTCPGELEDVVQRLQEATGSVVVGQIGRTVIIYRPSQSKLEAEEKKRQARRLYVRKEPKLKPLSLLQRRAQVPRLSGRGRRGSSRD